MRNEEEKIFNVSFAIIEGTCLGKTKRLDFVPDNPTSKHTLSWRILSLNKNEAIEELISKIRGLKD